MQVILKDEIIQKLKEVGLKIGDTVMVHTSLGKMGYCIYLKCKCFIIQLFKFV